VDPALKNDATTGRRNDVAPPHIPVNLLIFQKLKIKKE
jgi:hypothetical protein